MQVHATNISDVLILEPKVFGDDRGFFLESWNQKTLKDQAGIDEIFVQDNHSKSSKGVLRGLHYQLEQPQGKLVRVAAGRVLDVVVDIRKSSPTFGQYFSIELNDQNHLQLWIPPGMAHGFVVLSDTADFMYKATDYYAPQYERSILWNDIDLDIDWHLGDIAPSLSDKDKGGVSFKNAEYYD
jgi:dTDP-4-dehydrorhamnose 3,5-epimerase